MGGGFWGITWFSGEVERGGQSLLLLRSLLKLGIWRIDYQLKCLWCVHLRGGRGYIRISGSLRGD